jgi:hypothetical protein
MPFTVIQPPADETKFAEVGRELFEAAARLGIKLHREGFLMAWVNGTRALIERDATGAIVSMALMSVGHRWFPDDFTATVLASEGNTEAMLEFAKTIATALGAATLFYEAADIIVDHGSQLLHTIVELRLQ